MRATVVVVTGVVLVAAVVAGVAWHHAQDEPPATGVTVGWGGGEGDPACAYVAEQQTVDAKLSVEGTVSAPETVTITVTAYADENTSEPVGSGTSSVHVDGHVDRSLVVTIPVSEAPHLDDDGIAACRLSVEH